jgi:hypothetical protein
MLFGGTVTVILYFVNIFDAITKYMGGREILIARQCINQCLA